MKIAVTGGYGTGKSSVCNALAGLLHAQNISADQICRKQLDVNSPGWVQLKELWGPQFFLDNGEVDRPCVREKIFSNPVAKKELEDILHPLVQEEIERQCQVASLANRHTVSEIPLLFEGGNTYDFDFVLTIFVSNEIALKRVVSRDSITLESGRKIIDSQLPIERKMAMADYVINNSESFTATYCQLLHWCNSLK